MERVCDAVLQEEIWLAPLPGGGRLWVSPRPGRQCHALLSVDFGAIDDGAPGNCGECLPEGIAHFLEHRLFEKPEGDISERFSEVGADIDAQTGLTSTTYSCTSGVDGFQQALPLLVELVRRPHFTASGTVRERAIIEREIQLFEDHVEWVAFQSVLRCLYGSQRIAVDIAGTAVSLSRIDADLLARCHRHRYHPGALQLFVCGPVDARDVAARVCQSMMGWEKNGGGESAGADSVRPRRPTVTASPRDVTTGLAVPRPRALLAFPDLDAGQGGVLLLRRELALQLALDILFGPASGFFLRHYESGLIDGESFGGEVHAEESFSFCVVGGDTDDPEGLRSAVVEELERAAGSAWIEEDFGRACRRAYGDMVCRFEEVESRASFLESAAVRGCHPFELIDVYRSTRAEDVRRCLETCLCPMGIVTATVLPI